MSVLQRLAVSFLLVITACHCNDEKQIEALRAKAYSVGEDSPEYLGAWKLVLSLDPKNLEAHVMLGWKLITVGNVGLQEYGIELLEDSFDEEKVQPTINFDFPQTMTIAATIGRFRSQRKEYVKGKYFTELALELSKKHSKNGDPCMQMQLASMFDYFPVSTGQADSALAALTYHADDLLSHEKWSINEEFLSANMPGAANDPYVHCMLSLFSLSFYYRADTAATASRNYEMAARAWPTLADYVAPHLKQYNQELTTAASCVDRKIKLGVIAGVLSEGHSVTEDFGGVLQRLDRNYFDVTYIYVHETGKSYFVLPHGGEVFSTPVQSLTLHSPCAFSRLTRYCKFHKAKPDR